MNDNRKALKSGVWYTASNFLMKSIGFITTPIFARLLTKEEFGIYNNYLSWLAIMTIFITMNLESTLISARFDFKEKFDEYILSVLTLSSLSVVVWMAVLNIFSGYFVHALNLSRTYINVMIMYLLFLPAVSMFQAREQYCFKYKMNVAISLIISVGTAILSVLLVMFMKNKLSGRILGSVLPTVLIGGGLYVFFLTHGRKINISYWRYAIPICLPYIPHLLSMTFLNSTDRIMIQKFCGAEATAMYSLAYTCGMMVTVLLNSLNSAFAPWLGEKIDRNEYKDIKDFSRIYVCVFLFLTVGIMLFSPEVLYILGGDSYIDAKYVMTPVMLGCVCQFMYSLFVNVEQFKKKTGGMAIASLIAALINFGLNCMLIPRFGYLAAAYTTLIGYICLLLMHMFFVNRLGLGEIYDNRFILIILGVGILLTVFITWLYAHAILRYLLIIIYAAGVIYLLLKNKDCLFHMMKRS